MFSAARDSCILSVKYLTYFPTVGMKNDLHLLFVIHYALESRNNQLALNLTEMVPQ